MPATHVNRRREVDFLHAGTTKTGRPRYWFSRSAEGDLVEAIPEGYEVYEQPDAQVSQPLWGIAIRKTRHGAKVGDIFISLIHACRLNQANPFDDLTELQQHTEALTARPELWMPWNYRDALVRR